MVKKSSILFWLLRAFLIFTFSVFLAVSVHTQIDFMYGLEDLCESGLYLWLGLFTVHLYASQEKDSRIIVKMILAVVLVSLAGAMAGLYSVFLRYLYWLSMGYCEAGLDIFEIILRLFFEGKQGLGGQRYFIYIGALFSGCLAASLCHTERFRSLARFLWRLISE